MASTWTKKLRNLFNQPPFLVVKDVLNKIPGHPVEVASFFVLDLFDTPAKALPDCGTVRAGTVADVPGMCRLENKKEIFLKRLAEGESCAVAIRDAAVVGYIWFSDKLHHTEQRYNYRLEIPEDSIYSYDCYIQREYRLRGIWVLFQRYMLDEAGRLGRKKIITMVDYGNNASLKAHLRYGYVIKNKVFWVRCFSAGCFMSRSPAQRCTAVSPLKAR